VAAAKSLKLLSWAGILVALGAAFAVAFGNLPGCDEVASRDTQAVKINGRTFFLEVVADDVSRNRGLGGREHIDPDGGMLFVFKAPQSGNSGFVMRDCLIDIDILFLDSNGMVVTMHQMKFEGQQRGPGEGQPGEFNKAYEDRLTVYRARYPYQFAIELKGGTLPALGVKEGDRIDLPLQKLKAIAR
jgi:uncharacterized protein